MEGFSPYQVEIFFFFGGGEIHYYLFGHVDYFLSVLTSRISSLKCSLCPTFGFAAVIR